MLACERIAHNNTAETTAYRTRVKVIRTTPRVYCWSDEEWRCYVRT